MPYVIANPFRGLPSMSRLAPGRRDVPHRGLYGCSRPQRRDHPGVSRETAISDDGPVFTRELDDDLLQRDAAASDATRGPWPARAQVPSGRRAGYVRLWGGASFADVSTAAS
jgi:hypothetical protein